MTPDQLLTLHAANPQTTSRKLSTLPAKSLSVLLRSLHSHPGLIKPLWNHKSLQTALLSQKPPSEALLNHLQTLSHDAPTRSTLRTIAISATTALRAANFPLIPPLLRAARSLADSAAGEFHATLLRIFVATAPADPALVHPLLEAGVSGQQYRDVIAYVMRVVRESDDHAVLLPTLLASPLPLARPLMEVLSTGKGDTLVGLQACLFDDVALVPYLATLIHRAVFAASAPVTTPLLRTLFVLLSQGNEAVDNQVSDTLTRMLRAQHLAFKPPAEGSSKEHPRLAVFRNAVRTIPGGSEQDVTGFLEDLLWSSCRSTAVTLLEEIFIWHPNSRAKILKAIVAGLSTPASNIVHNAFITLFKNLVSQPTTFVAMRSCVDILKESLDYVFFMPNGLNATFVEYLARVLGTVSGGQDKIIMFLRKLSGARAISEQRIACRGLIAVLSVDGTKSIHDDASDLLVMLTEADASEYLIGLMLHSIEQSSLTVQRVGKVVKAITGRLSVVADNGEMNICRFFDNHLDEYSLDGPIPLMLRFCAAAQGNVMSPFLRTFVRYLCDAQGAIKHACVVDKSPVPVAQRLQLLCDLLEAALGIGTISWDETVVRVYGTAIVLRDSVFISLGSNEKGKQINRQKRLEDEHLTMRQAAAANCVGGSFSECNDAKVLSMLKTRIQALSALGRIIPSEVRALVNIVRSDIFLHLEADIRSLLSLKEASISSTPVDELLLIVRKFFVISCPWIPSNRSNEKSDTVEGDKRDERHGTEPEKSSSSGLLSFLSAVGLDKDNVTVFEGSNLAKLQEGSMMRMRQTSLSILCVLFSRGLIENDVAFIISLMDGLSVLETGKEKPRSGTNHGGEEDLVKVVSKVGSLFRLEFASSLSIGLTLSYLAILGHLISKEHKPREVMQNVRKLVFEMLTSLLREYSIRHQSVMRAILKLLTKTLEAESGIKFAESVLLWLGDHPCLLNSRFAETDDDAKGKLGVDEFDIDILEEARALDADEDSEREEASESIENANRTKASIGNVITNSIDGDIVDERCLDSMPRVTSDNADPVKSLCFDETGEVAFLSVNAMLEFYELVLKQDIQRYRQALRSTSESAPSTGEFEAESVLAAVKGFCDSTFMKSFISKQKPTPVLLEKRLSCIAQRSLEIAQLALQLLLKILRVEASAATSQPHLRTVASIVEEFYASDSSGTVLCAALYGEGRSNRSSLREGVNVSAAELFRFVSSRRDTIDDTTQESISSLRKLLKSRKNRLPHVRSVKTTQSSGLDELESGDYFRVSRPQKRQRLRSRNPDVDEWLRDEKDGDNYADLEDFVVAMDADQL